MGRRPRNMQDRTARARGGGRHASGLSSAACLPACLPFPRPSFHCHQPELSLTSLHHHGTTSPAHHTSPLLCRTRRVRAVRDAGRAESFRCVRGWGIPLHRGSHPIRRASCRELPEAQQARRHAPPISHATQPVNRRCSLLLLQCSSSSRRRWPDGRTTTEKPAPGHPAPPNHPICCVLRRDARRRRGGRDWLMPA